MIVVDETGLTLTILTNGWLNVYGWYQSAGDGEYYKVMTENINGKNVPILTAASGAGNSNYYRSQDLAQDTMYDGESTH